MADVRRAIVQRVDHLGAAARHRHHVEIETFADEHALPLGEQERQRKDAALRGIGLAVTKLNGLRADRLRAKDAKQGGN